MTADEIKAIRQSLGLTQFRFAQRLGCSPQTIQKWEQGTYSPNATFVERLLKERDKIVPEPSQRSIGAL